LLNYEEALVELWVEQKPFLAPQEEGRKEEGLRTKERERKKGCW
jgi:hypothetical protein